MATRIIGIAGGSASGKTSIVRLLAESLGSCGQVIHQDAYYRPYAEMTLEERKKQNFDHPDAFDIDLLCGDLDRLRHGEAIEMPVYDYTNYTRAAETTAVMPHPVILVEGLLILWYPQLRELCDLKIFVDAEDDERLIRRIMRDTKERGRSLESVLDQYRETVKPMHEQFIAPSKKYADIIIPRGAENEPGIDILRAHLKQMLEN